METTALKTKSIYVDMPSWSNILVDDFIACIGVKGYTNTIYHVAEVKRVTPRGDRVKRVHLGVVKSDLLTACRREPTLHWVRA